MYKTIIIIFEIIIITIFIVLIISLIGNIFFDKKVKIEVSELFKSGMQNENKIIQKKDLQKLPLCVQKWLENSQVIGKEKILTAHFRQKGLMRMEEEKKWMPTEAEQDFTVDEPGFIWSAKIKAAPLFHIVGRDKYYEGKGNMKIKVLSFITVADESGMEIDQGTMIRYLAEMVWFPTAALSSYIEWEEVDSNSAKAIMSYGGITASGIFIFNEKGEVINFIAKRYMESNGQYVLKTWSTPMKDYKEFNGFRIPSKGEAIWKLESGDFCWYKVEITEAEYNKEIN